MQSKLTNLVETNKTVVNQKSDETKIEPSSQLNIIENFSEDKAKVEKNNVVDCKNAGKKETNHKKLIKTSKAVNVTACDYNEEIGMLAIALIDKEVKIYNLRQSGTKISLIEQFSFMVHFNSDAAASYIYLERYVTNGRPIICIGTFLGDIALYYLDDEKLKREVKGGPTLLSKFHFTD